MKLFLAPIAFILFTFLNLNSFGQDANPFTNSQNNNTINKQVTLPQSDFAQLERSIMLDNKVKTIAAYNTDNLTALKESIKPRKRAKLPLLVGILGGVILYYGSNALLFGGTDNVGTTGLGLSAAGGALLSLIVNSSGNQTKENYKNSRKEVPDFPQNE